MSSATITVREFARLTTDAIEQSLDCAQVPVTAFDWLCQLNASFSRAGAALVQIEGRNWLKLDNYVGVIESPCGTRIEILPKNVEAKDCIAKSRELLGRMIRAALDLPKREAGPASLKLFDAPLSEWVIRQFLGALDHLIKRGVRFDYLRVEEERRFLRGQLNVVAQMRQPLGRQHYFQIRHDMFVPDRAENRLLKLALEQVCKVTKNSDNWRLAHELRLLFLEVPVSRQVDDDFHAWRCDRLMAHYQPVKPWCELILNQQMPLAVTGQWQGMSLLFPMEKLYERYVAAWLRRNLQPGTKLRAPAADKYLCIHENHSMFRLEPDLLVEYQSKSWVLDTKWKRLNSADKQNKYNLSQADFYQLFAYGKNYLNQQEHGELILIYPLWRDFKKALPVFDFSNGMNLWVLPFDLENEVLVDVDKTTLSNRLLPSAQPANENANFQQMAEHRQ